MKHQLLHIKTSMFLQQQYISVIFFFNFYIKQELVFCCYNVTSSEQRNPSCFYRAAQFIIPQPRTELAF